MTSTDKFTALLRHYLGGGFCDPDTIRALELISDLPSAPARWEEIVIGSASAQVNLAMNRAFESSLGEDIDWRIVRFEARFLLLNKTLQQNVRDRAKRETAFLPLDLLMDTSIGRFAQRWAVAWSCRDLERLVSLFCSDGQYSDALFKVHASGHAGLRRVFAALFHGYRISLAVEEVALSEGLVLRWVRSITSLQDLSKSLFKFRGQSKIELRADRVRKCEDVLEKPESGVRLEKDVVLLKTLRLSRKKVG